MPNYTPRQRTDFFAIHCSATPPSMNVDEYEIRKWHLERKWIDIGYNVVIPRNGSVQIGRPLDFCGAHVEGYNNRALGICLVGGLKEGTKEPENNYTMTQFEALLDTLHFLWRYAPNAIAKGHNQFPNVAKDCPCFDVTEWLNGVGLTPTGGEFHV